MDLRLLFHTIQHLRLCQIIYQLRNRIWHPRYKELPFNGKTQKLCLSKLIDKTVCLKEKSVAFLNIRSCFSSWNDISNGMLWAYNLNYMDWLCQEGIAVNEGSKWIESFIAGLSENRIGLDPYPIALRGINWIKFITLHCQELPNDQVHKWNGSLYSQYALLCKKLEYHLMGNHLLEDAFSLFIAAIYFNDLALYKKSTKLLRKELNEQILLDGAHFEQSPMYHCIMLERLLDCVNFSQNNLIFDKQESFNGFLRKKAELMLGHLESMTYSDDTMPLLNDSALGIASEPIDIFVYARRLHLEWSGIALGECGYRRFSGGNMETIVDVGNITASYQPGHSHADTFNYELRINGKPFIVDTGISTYNKTQRRQFERSTAAHNTVSVEGQNSSEAWGGFRMGRRAKVCITKEWDNGIEAFHDGFGKKFRHTRRFNLVKNRFEITDSIPTECTATSYIHFAPNAQVLSCGNNEIVTDMATIIITGAVAVEIVEEKASTKYNSFENSKTAKIRFCKELTYNICI